MGGQSSIVACVAGLLAIAWHGAANAEESTTSPNFMSVWTGFSASAESQYAYAGTAYALSGDIDAGGILFRVGLGGGRFCCRSRL
jgi:hypothetical protein